MKRPVAITRVGAVGPFGAGYPDFREWWKAGRKPLIGPVTTVDEPWLPSDRVCEVPFWKPRVHLPDRKAIKLMTRRVQYGVAAALEAWGPELDDMDETLSGLPPEVPPELRGMYTGCGVPVDEDWTFREAVETSIVDDHFDMTRFGGPAQDLLNPLWLVKSLTNNVLAFSAKALDLQGANDNFEAGSAGPLMALGSASQAIREGRLDAALAGGSDSLVTMEGMLVLARHGAFDRDDPLIPSQGGAFVKLQPGRSGDFGLLAFASRTAPLGPDETPLGAPWPPEGVEVALALASEAAWKQARRAGVRTNQGSLLRCPRLPEGPGDLDLWASLGDPGAAAGALLLVAAWAIRHEDGDKSPIELAAVGPGGEVGVALLGTLP